MDKVLADTLKANLKSATTPESRQQAQTLAMIAVVDCQFTTNLTAEVHALMARKNWPEELATLYLRHELNTLTTNTVNAVIRPQ